MALSKIKAKDDELNIVQDNVDKALVALAAKPLANVAVAGNVALTTSNSAVAHGLGGPPQGWIQVKQSAVVTVYSDTAHPDPNNYIYLKSSAPATVSLLFF